MLMNDECVCTYASVIQVLYCEMLKYDYCYSFFACNWEMHKSVMRVPLSDCLMHTYLCGGIVSGGYSVNTVKI